MSGAASVDFKAFASIPRLKRGCLITEKIDGTNACVYVPGEEGGPILAGSRSRWVTPATPDNKTSDNYGFAAWVRDHEDELRALGPGRHYGEWWGAGIQRRYGLSEKRFSLFNVTRWRDLPPPPCCHVVPVLYEGNFETDIVDIILDHLRIDGSTAAPGFMDPEGIVVRLNASGHLYKVTLGGDGHKGAKNGNPLQSM